MNCSEVLPKHPFIPNYYSRRILTLFPPLRLIISRGPWGRQQYRSAVQEPTRPLATASAAQRALILWWAMPSARHVKMDTVLRHLHHLAQHVNQDIILPRDRRASSAPLGALQLMQAVVHACHALMDHSLHLVHQLAAPVQPDSLSCRSVYHRVLHRVV